jgi:hypothetical protein
VAGFFIFDLLGRLSWRPRRRQYLQLQIVGLPRSIVCAILDITNCGRARVLACFDHRWPILNSHRERVGFKNIYRNVNHRLWLIKHRQPKKGAIMLKIVVVTGALAIGLVSSAYAQNTGPAAQTDRPGMTNSNSDAMKKSGTTGMSSGSGSGMNNKGGANGSPAMAPKTTTGPAGSASKSESPPK